MITLSELDYLKSIWVALRRIEERFGEQLLPPEPVAPNVYVDPPDLSEVTAALQGLGARLNPEEFARVIASSLPAPVVPAENPVSTELVETLKKLEFRMQAPTQAYGGGASQLQAQRPDGSWGPTRLNDAGELVVTTAPGGEGGGSTGGLTNTELRASPVPVSGTVSVVEPVTVDGAVALDTATLSALETISVANFPASQPVSGAVDVNNFPAVQPVSDNGGSLTVDGTVGVNNFPASQAVTGPLTNTELRASAVPVATGLTQPLTDTQLRAAAVPVSTGLAQPLTDAQLRAAAVPVSGTFWQATQPVSGTVTVNPPAMTLVTLTTDALVAVTAEALISFSINNAGTVTTATSFTVPAGQSFYITSISIDTVNTAATVVANKYFLRHTTGAALAIASPRVWAGRAASMPGTQAANTGLTDVMSTFPDGLRFPTGWVVGMSHIGTAATMAATITVAGYLI